jgi:serine protease Do
MGKRTWVLSVILASAALATGLGLGARFAPRGVAQAAVPPAAPAPAITPKTQVPQEARSLSQAFAATARALRPSVVRIDVEMERPKLSRRDFKHDDVPPEMQPFFERFFNFGNGSEGLPTPGPGRGTGSGVVIDGAGNIITNSHVAEKATKVTVTFVDGRELPAKIVGTDPKTDVAVLRLLNPPAGLVAARLGDSDALEVGEWVLAIGSPLGLDQSVTAGIISGKGKVSRNVHMSGERMREYIQTDAKINPGNSGGPLVNLQGEVIGINTLINVGPGGAYGFAIPISQARRVAQMIIRDGHVRHAWLGVGIGDVKDGVAVGADGEAEKKGPAPKAGPARAAWVSQVIPRGPAEKSGVHVGDIITQIDKQKIAGAADVVDYVSGQKVGDKVTLALLRDGRPSNVQVTLGELPARPGEEPGPQVEKDKVGVHLQDLTPEMARMLGMDAQAKGAVVSGVEPNSRAAKAGLRAEDVIVEIDRKPVASAEEAVNALRAGGKAAHLLRVRRGDTFRFVTIPGS